jgi:hypothetical protein
MAIRKLTTFYVACDGCDLQWDRRDYSTKRVARRELEEGLGGGWEQDGDALYCPACKWRAATPPEPATEPPARWVRGGDGSHWDGCYSVHWDCAIRELRWQLQVGLQGTVRGSAAMERARMVYLETGNE